jgi:mRNA interferase MazF
MKKFELVLVNLDPTVGHEVKKTRPCLIISPDEMNFALKTIIIAPLTSHPRAIPTRVTVKATEQSGLTAESYVMLDQIKTIDKTRIIAIFGEISEPERQAVTDTLHALFAL